MFYYGKDIAVLEPAGMIALKEKDLIEVATYLMLIVVIPVFIITVVFAWKYRAGNNKAKYDPEWNHSHVAEAIWWGFPCFIILILSILTWKSSHELDPFKPLKSDVKPVKIQVVALQWKWLFIYPEYDIATVNVVAFPVNTPINFELTSDAPMNSFWIPKLGGQIYAMPGMRSKLHLIADQGGDFRGSSANLSGRGFAGMTFTAKATSKEEFDAWVTAAKSSTQVLDLTTYKELAKPSEYNPPAIYTLQKADLFDWIVMKYMMPMDAK